MHFRSSEPLLLSFALLLSACAPMDGPDRRDDMRPGGQAPGVHSVSLTDRHQALLAELGAELNIGPDQRVAWDDYCTAVGALVADQMRGSRAVAASDDAVRQIDRKVDVVRNRLAAMEDIQLAAERLYQALSPAQRTLADQRLAATVPALYSGLGDRQDGRREAGEGADGRKGRRGPPQGGGGGF
jgi:hypothetical protein